MKIGYGLEQEGRVSVVIYNILGHKVMTLVYSELKAGKHEAIWDGKDMTGRMAPSGMYLCRVETMERFKTIKLLMTK